MIKRAYVMAEKEEDQVKKQAIYEAIKNIESMCRYMELTVPHEFSQESEDVLYERVEILKCLVSKKNTYEEGFKFLTNNGLPHFLECLEIIDYYYYGEIHDLLNKIANRKDKGYTISVHNNTAIKVAHSENIEVYYAELEKYLILIKANMRRLTRSRIRRKDLKELFELDEKALNNPINNAYALAVEKQLNLYGYPLEPMTVKMPSRSK